ncbi:peptidylprolyl isomerase [Blattabacterium sp. (Blattella germanica) str. Bge]|uniref:peptidylprolyl isomerase n=1 Tax=Blattabacterium sp. (Blattella germanica) TaxID=624186 RepID=UPI0001BB62AA|nr:peptidylprolyl isomerase [Blattabacterium sp. (Blattella germanica)]ACY40617.1 peptidylprolyl isomerase [Blattabacterium sp. (Blattella germanica) str. Bge]
MIKNSLKKFSLFLLFFLIYSHFSYSFEKLEGIYAIVGNEIILDSEIKTKNSKNCLDDLDDLLIEKLMLYHAKKDVSIQISNQELELKTQAFLSEMSKKYANQEEFLIQQFKKKEWIPKLTETIKNHLYIEKFYQKITDNVEISPKEVKYFFTKNKSKIPFLPKKMCISYLVCIPKLSQMNRMKIIDFLKKIKKEIHSDIDFSIQAILFSEDNYSASNGGLIQGIKINRLSKEFKHVVLSLSEKEISEPFETDSGFHIIKLEKNKDEVDLRHILIKPKYTKHELRKTKSFVDSIQKRIFNRNLENLIDKNNQIVNYSIWNKIWVEENQLSQNMKKALNSLEKGGISNPYKEIVNEKEAFFIVQLLDSIPSRPISFETDYTILKNLVKDIKKKDAIKNWAKKTLKKTYINCS